MKIYKLAWILMNKCFLKSKCNNFDFFYKIVYNLSMIEHEKLKCDNFL